MEYADGETVWLVINYFLTHQNVIEGWIDPLVIFADVCVVRREEGPGLVRRIWGVRQFLRAFRVGRFS